MSRFPLLANSIPIPLSAARPLFILLSLDQHQLLTSAKQRSFGTYLPRAAYFTARRQERNFGHSDRGDRRKLRAGKLMANTRTRSCPSVESHGNWARCESLRERLNDKFKTFKAYEAQYFSVFQPRYLDLFLCRVLLLHF